MAILPTPQYWVIKTMLDYDPGSINGDLNQKGVCFTRNKGNCSGVTNWYRIPPGHPARAMYERVNPGDAQADFKKKWQWIIRNHPGGAIYAPEGDDGYWQCPSIVMGSIDYIPGQWNIVKVIEEEGAYFRIETIPAHLYETVTFEEYPYYFLDANCTAANGVTSRTPVGRVLIPQLDPSLFQHHGNYSGSWIPKGMCHGRIELVPPPDDPPTDPPPSLDHVVEIIKKTWLRQQPRLASGKMYQANVGARFRITEEIKGFGKAHIGSEYKGWLQMSKARRVS